MKSGNSRGLSDHPVVVFLGALVAIIGIYVFITGYDSLPQIFSDSSKGNSSDNASVDTAAKSRAEALVVYDAIYDQAGWCALWDRLTKDELVQGNCPTSLQPNFESINTQDGTKSIVTAVQVRVVNDIEVRYPACVVFDDPERNRCSGGTVERWQEKDYIGSDLTVHSDSIFVLFFRCDNAWAP